MRVQLQLRSQLCSQLQLLLLCICICCICQSHAYVLSFAFSSIANRPKQCSTNFYLYSSKSSSSSGSGRGSHKPMISKSKPFNATTATATATTTTTTITTTTATRKQTKILFQSAKEYEKHGLWNEARQVYQDILKQDPLDAHSHLGYARLEARRRDTNSARNAFQQGTSYCPQSIHLWQAWALFEQTSGDSGGTSSSTTTSTTTTSIFNTNTTTTNIQTAKALFQHAMTLDPTNPYVCHAYGLLEQKQGNIQTAQHLWNIPIQANRPTAALVCSLGALLISLQQYNEARLLYTTHASRLTSEKERTEVYLAAAWLEETYLKDVERAKEWIRNAGNTSRVQVALARLEGRTQQDHQMTKKTLANTCMESTQDGRAFNAWASIEVKARKYSTARDILQQGMNKFPNDKDLVQAAGRVEERVGNYTGARLLYGASLVIEPSAPTLLALAMLELRHAPEPNYEKAKGFLDEALLLDPRHGPVYNAYGNMQRARGNIQDARNIYHLGIQAQCTDPASVFHGLAQLELSMGNIGPARDILKEGLKQVASQARFMDSSRHERAIFLVHTLGMVELNTNRALDASIVFRDGIAQYGNSSQLLLGAALSEAKLGNEDKARGLFERAVRADKRHAQAWQAWGMLEMRAGHFSAAKALFESGIKTSPRHGALYHAYGTMEARMGNLDNARVLFRAGLGKCPKHVALYQGWASVELRDGNLEKAKKLIGEALTRDKAHGAGWLIAADIEEQQGNSGLVGLLLRRGIECAPFDAGLYRAHGEYLVRNGKINEAREVFEKGLEVNPTHAPLYHSLAELEARVFNIEGLAKLNKRAAKIFSNNAMEPSAFSSQVFGDRMRDQYSPTATGVGERIGEEESVNTSFSSLTQLEEELFKFEVDD